MNVEAPAKRIALIGVPSSAGARQLGQELAPDCLRRAGLTERLRFSGYEVTDYGDVEKSSYRADPDNPTRQNLQRVVQVLTQVAAVVETAAKSGARVLVLGGDCTVTIGVLAGLVKCWPELGMLYVDGDVDLNTPETTPSGIFDGMVIAHILGLGAEPLSHIGPRCPLLDQSKITLFGYNAKAGSIDPAEVDLLQALKVAKYPLEQVQPNAPFAAKRALAGLEAAAAQILIHCDVDVIDFEDFPAADVPHRPGLRLSEARDALAVFLASRKVVGLVLTEFNGLRDQDSLLATRLVDAVVSALPPARLSP
jgi:arginase